MLPQQKQKIAALIEQALAGIGVTGVPVVLERPKIESHGDVACNVAMQVAKSLRRNPREIGQAIADALKVNPAAAGLVAAAEVAGPGFVNVRLTAAARQEVVRLSLREGESFGTQSVHAGERVMVEFVSANPTGPLHLGHARQAALGDALANLLAAQGWQVAREYYYNDAGVQIANLALSVQARARELRGEKSTFRRPATAATTSSTSPAISCRRMTVTARDGAAGELRAATRTTSRRYAILRSFTCATSRTRISRRSASASTTTSWSPRCTPTARSTRPSRRWSIPA